MNVLKTMAAASAVMMVIGSGVAFAKEKKATTPVVHTPESIACSKQADEKGLKGKERKKFRAHCIRDMKKAPKEEKKS